MVTGFRNIDIANRIEVNSLWIIQLAIPRTSNSPFRDESPITVEPLDAIIATVRDVNIACRVYSDSSGILELAVAGPRAAPSGDECSV